MKIDEKTITENSTTEQILEILKQEWMEESKRLHPIDPLTGIIMGTIKKKKKK